MPQETLGALAVLGAAAAVGLYRGQGPTSVASWVLPAAVIAIALGQSDAPVVRVATTVGVVVWSVLLTISERVGQYWWRMVLRRPVPRGVLPASDDFVSRTLERALFPAWRAHQAYLDNKIDASSLLRSYLLARDAVGDIDPSDERWAALIEEARRYLDDMISHLEGRGPDFDVVHDEHDRLRAEWRQLDEDRRRPWRATEWF